MSFVLTITQLASYPNATIFATARDPTKAAELQSLASANGSRIQILQADALDISSLQLVAKTIEQSSKSLDMVIYNTGVLVGIGNMLEVGVEPLKENIETNVYGAYYAAVQFSPLLLKSAFANKSLVLISSSFGSMSLSDKVAAEHESLFGPGYDATAMYNISKASRCLLIILVHRLTTFQTALNRLGKELDTVLRRQGVPVLLVHPGLVKTDMNPYGDLTVDESSSGMYVQLMFRSIDKVERLTLFPA